MRFLVDECTGPAVAQWLRNLGYDVVSIYDECPGVDDAEVINRAVREERVLVTNDKDFGDKVFRDGKAHRGVVLLRLADERSARKIQALRRVLAQGGERIAGRFVVVTERTMRISGM